MFVKIVLTPLHVYGRPRFWFQNSGLLEIIGAPAPLRAAR